MAKQAPRKDGRTLRAERSRAAVAAAMLDLIQEGELRPTAADVAKRAGVSLRLVFHHFKDMAAVHREANSLQMERIRPLVSQLPNPAAAFDKRLTEFVRRRAQLYEEIAPVRRAGRATEHASEVMAEGLAWIRQLKREQVETVFATELEGFSGSERRERLSCLQQSLSWMAWESLRSHQGLTERQAKSSLKRAIELALASPAA